MSLIAAIAQEGKVFMACDSFSTSEDGDIKRRLDMKMFKNGKYLIGFAGSARTGQIFKPNYWKPPKDIYDFPDTMRAHIMEKGCMSTNNPDVNMDVMLSNFLIGFNGKIYEILVDFQLVEPQEEYSALGSGKTYALGSLFTTKFSSTISVIDRLDIAMRAGSYFCDSVGGKIHYEYI